jgi:hypothetical protein
MLKVILLLHLFSCSNQNIGDKKVLIQSINIIKKNKKAGNFVKSAIKDERIYNGKLTAKANLLQNKVKNYYKNGNIVTKIELLKRIKQNLTGIQELNNYLQYFTPCENISQNPNCVSYSIYYNKMEKILQDAYDTTLQNYNHLIKGDIPECGKIIDNIDTQEVIFRQNCQITGKKKFNVINNIFLHIIAIVEKKPIIAIEKETNKDLDLSPIFRIISLPKVYVKENNYKKIKNLKNFLNSDYYILQDHEPNLLTTHTGYSLGATKNEKRKSVQNTSPQDCSSYIQSKITNKKYSFVSTKYLAEFCKMQLFLKKVRNENLFTSEIIKEYMQNIIDTTRKEIIQKLISEEYLNELNNNFYALNTTEITKVKPGDLLLDRKLTSSNVYLGHIGFVIANKGKYIIRLSYSRNSQGSEGFGYEFETIDKFNKREICILRPKLNSAVQDKEK